MSEKTITLTESDLWRIRAGYECLVDGGDGVEVDLITDDWPQQNRRRPVVRLSYADLDLIEQPGGLVVTDTTGTTGWTIRVAP